MYGSVCSWCGQSTGQTSYHFCVSNQNLRKEWSLVELKGSHGGAGVSGGFFLRRDCTFPQTDMPKATASATPTLFLSKRRHNISPPDDLDASHVSYSLQAACALVWRRIFQQNVRTWNKLLRMWVQHFKLLLLQFSPGWCMHLSLKNRPPSLFAYVNMGKGRHLYIYIYIILTIRAEFCQTCCSGLNALSSLICSLSVAWKYL